jgi:hypothetical protein
LATNTVKQRMAAIQFFFAHPQAPVPPG